MEQLDREFFEHGTVRQVVPGAWNSETESFWSMEQLGCEFLEHGQVRQGVPGAWNS